MLVFYLYEGISPYFYKRQVLNSGYLPVSNMMTNARIIINGEGTRQQS